MKKQSVSGALNLLVMIAVIVLGTGSGLAASLSTEQYNVLTKIFDIQLIASECDNISINTSYVNMIKVAGALRFRIKAEEFQGRGRAASLFDDLKQSHKRSLNDNGKEMYCASGITCPPMLRLHPCNASSTAG